MTDSGGTSRFFRDARSFLGGLGTAGFVFVVFHRLDVALGGTSRVAALGLLTLVVGWGAGAELGVGRCRGLLHRRLMAAVLGILWGVVAAGPSAMGWRGLLAAGVAGAWLAACTWGRPALESRPTMLLFLSGWVAGFVVLSAGLAGVLGVVGVMLVLGAPAVALALLVAPEPGRGAQSATGGEDADRVLRWGRLILCGAGGALAVALLRTYSHGTGWFGYAAADLGIAFGLGLLLRALLPVRRGSEWGPLLGRALGLVGVALLTGWSFLFYPDLIFSEPAVVQSGRALLTAGRMFPLWGLAFCVALLLPRREGRGGGGKISGMSHPADGTSPAGRTYRGSPGVVAGLGAAVVLLLPAGQVGFWNYVVCGGAAVLCAFVACRRGFFAGEGDSPAGRVFPVAGSLLGLSALAWMALAGQNAGWRGLRYGFAWYQREIRGRYNAPPPPDLRATGAAGVRVTSTRRHGRGLDAEARSAGETGHFVSGGLAGTSRVQDRAVVSLMLTLLRGARGGIERVGVLGPALEGTRRGLSVLLPGAEVVEISGAALPAGGLGRKELDAAVLGPGALSRARSSGAVLSRESLSALRRGLRAGGVVATWLPTRTCGPDGLGAAVATVLSVFPETVLFTCRDEIVLLSQVGAGGEGGEERGLRVDYAAVRAAFVRERSRRWLEESGYWSPEVLMSEFAGGREAVSGLAADAEVLSVWRPVRPPVLGRDLARVSDPSLLVLVAQHRLAARANVTQMLSFSSENEKKVALASLGRVHRELTQATLERIGRTSGGAAMDRLVRALRGPRGRLDLLAPEARGADVKLAVALYRLGAARKALEFLRGEDRSAEERFAVFYWRGRCLQELEQSSEALAAYQKALGVRPGRVEVLLRVARIHLENRHLSRAQRRLEEVLEKDPDSVEALVNLSYIHGKRHRFERATELARRALEIDPDNSAARDQYVLYRWRARLGGEGER